MTPLTTWGLIGLVVLGIPALGVGAYLRYKRGQITASVDQLVEQSTSETPGDALTLQPPDAGGLLGLFHMWRHEARRKRLARKGYVEWHKIGAKKRRPQWVKPERDGAGEPEYYDSDEKQTYVFPPDALVTDARSGAYVAYHRVGEAEPINLQNPGYPSLDADRLEEVINLKAESDKPGFFDRLDLDTQTLVWIGLLGAFAIFAAYRYMGGAG